MNSWHFNIHCDSHTGIRRSNNEDCVVADESHSLIVLADGMGGHKAGEVASAMAANGVMKNLGHWLEKSRETTISRNLKKAITRFINEANSLIYQESLLDYEKRGMGTTIVVAVLRKNKLTIAHVGDSRAYLLRDEKLIQLTEDHTKVREQIRSGMITFEKSSKSPLRHVLTRAVGVMDYVEVDIQEIIISDEDKVLLCSDGLTDMLSEQEITKILNTEITLDKSVSKLIKCANDAGGIDNITLALTGPLTLSATK
jgi:serine/threonine protein phosphatase PrpC